MNASVENLGVLAPWLFKTFAWPMLWQSSLLILIVLSLDLLLRNRVRAAVRYSLWLIVLLKLLLPPSLALPSGVAWWVRPADSQKTQPFTQTSVVISHPAATPGPFHSQAQAFSVPPTRPPALTPAASVLLCWSGVSLALLAWVLLRWFQVGRVARRASLPPSWLNELLDESRRSLRLRRPVRLRLTDSSMSPAVFGLFRPVLLLPETLAAKLTPDQMRTVLLHELIHLRRRDVWANCVQALLQIAYWWHPLLWFANARIRRLREEAVDDAVMLALRDEAQTYPTALLEVARLALRRRLASLGLVGIMETRSSLHRRIERLLDFRPQAKAGLTFASAFSVAIFAALAVPMGEPPAHPTQPVAMPPGGPSPVDAISRLQNAVTLFHLGKLHEAESILKQLVKQDPGNQGAYYYLDAISKTRYDQALIARSSQTNPPVRVPTKPPPKSAAQLAIIEKLETIHFDEVHYGPITLGEILPQLSAESKRRDPAKEGVSFRGPALIDPTTGLPIASEPGHVEQVSVSNLPNLRNVSLLELLDAIVRAADKPIEYSVEDSGVTFSPAKLYNRIFKTDLRALEENLSQLRTPLAQTNVGMALYDRLRTLGVDLLKPPKAFFYNDRESHLMVRATLKDLDIIEQELQTLNTGPALINILTRFLEARPAYVDKLWELSGGTRNAQGPLPMILPPEKLAALVSALEQLPDTHTLGVGDVTTADQRQTQIQIVNEVTVTNSINSRALLTPGVANENELYITDALPFGPSLDIVPKVAGDGAEIELQLWPQVTDFLGYAPTNSVPVYIKGKRHLVTRPVPEFLVRALPVTTNNVATPGQFVVPSGHTVCLVLAPGYKISSTNAVEYNAGSTKERILVLVTPQLIDPAGNPLHANSKSGSYKVNGAGKFVPNSLNTDRNPVPQAPGK